ncbi:DUF6375 family protein [Verrucomicrobiota bacterium sgz303538]
MKAWNSYGSEHSANLVMIGKFKDAISAEKAKEAIDLITDYMTTGSAERSSPDRYPDGLMDLLQKVGFHSLSPGEIEQFTMDIHSELKEQQVVITTDEPDVSAFLKLMVDKGARVEVFSAHFHPDPNGRDTTSND